MALDSVYLDIKDLDGLRAEADDAVAVGFDAKVAIHPTQVAVIRAGYAPTDGTGRLGAGRARRVADERGVFQFEGLMVDARCFGGGADRRARAERRWLEAAEMRRSRFPGDRLRARLCATNPRTCDGSMVLSLIDVHSLCR